MCTRIYRALFQGFFVLGAVCAVLPAQAEIRVHGRLLDSENAAVAGAVVHLEELLPSYERVELRYGGRVSPDSLATVRTDAAGYYELTVPAPGSYKVALGVRGHLDMEYLLRPIFRTRELPDAVLVPASTFELEVVDPEGRATADVGVALYPNGRRQTGWRSRLRLVRTRDDGVAVLPRGRGEELQMQVLAPGYPLFLVDMRQDDARKATMTLTLQPGVTGRVQVVDPAGRGVPNALLYQVAGFLPLARTDAEGLASIVIAPARHEPPTVSALTTDHFGHANLRFDGPQLSSKKGKAAILRIEPRQKVKGRVIDSSTGDPLAGATVWIERGTLVQSDRHGHFELNGSTASRVQLAAIADGYALTRLMVQQGPAASPSVLALEPAVTVRGQVVDIDGKGIAGVDVRSDSGRRRTSDESTTRTTRDGAFELTGLPASGHSLFFRKEGFAPATLELEGLEPFEKRDGLHVTLRAGSAALGTVLDSDDAPVAGAEVRLIVAPSGDPRSFRRFRRHESERLMTSTDGQGRFRIPHISTGTYTLEVSARGFSPLAVPGLTIEESAGDTELGTVVLVPGASIAGIVVDASGIPIAGAEIRTGPANEMQYNLSLRSDPVAVSDASGHFQIDDFQHGRSVGVLVSSPGYAPRAVIGQAAEDPEPLEVQLEKAGHIRGRVIDADGAPVEQATVLASSDPRTEWSRQYTRTDATGLFALEDVIPGRQRLSVQAEGYLTYELQDLVVPADDTLEDLEIVLKTATILAGRLLDSAERPVAGMVEVTREGLSDSRTSQTDSSGQFQFTNLTPGTYVVTGRDRTFREVTKTVELGTGELGTGELGTGELGTGTRTIELVFEPGWEVSGRVFDASGRAVAGAELLLEPVAASELRHRQRWYFAGSSEGSDLSRADGTFVLSDVAPGRYHLTATKVGYARAKTREPFEVDGPLAGIDLELPRGITLRGRVLGLAPEELSRLQVNAYSTNQHQSGQVDFEGQYSIPSVVPGSWTVRARLPEGRETIEKLEVAEGQSEAVLDLEFTDGYSLSGVITVAGKPAQNIFVTVRLDGDPQQRPRFTRTLLEGNFRFEGLPVGLYHLTATSGGPSLEERQIQIHSDQQVSIDIEGAALSGQVVDIAGQPIAGAALSLERQAPTDDGTMRGQLTRFRSSQRTDSLGQFSWDVQPGDWILVAEKAEYARAEARVRVENGVPMSGLELTMTRAEGFSFEVVTASGEVPTYVDAAIFGPDGGREGGGQYRPGQDGRVHVSTVTAGTWELLVRADAGTARLPIQVPGELGRVVLPPAGHLYLRVPGLRDGPPGMVILVGPDGKPFDPLWQHKGSISQTGMPLRGEARLGPLVPGQWTIQVTHPDGRTWNGTATVLAGEVSELTLPSTLTPIP